MSNNQRSASADNNRYFNEHASGIGYLNAFKELGDEGQPGFLSVQVSVIQGPSDDVHYEYHDLIATSERVRNAILAHRDAIEDSESNVLIHFKMVNPRAKAFTYKQGERAGELGTAIGGILTRINTLKVNGEVVYQDESTSDREPETRQRAVG